MGSSFLLLIFLYFSQRIVCFDVSAVLQTLSHVVHASQDEAFVVNGHLHGQVIHPRVPLRRFSSVVGNDEN